MNRSSTNIVRHAIANTLIGVVMFFLVFTSFLHYTGAWYSQFLPMSDASTYDNTGAIYNVSRILTSEFTLDEAAYQAYSPLFIRFVHLSMVYRYDITNQAYKYYFCFGLRPLLCCYNCSSHPHFSVL